MPIETKGVCSLCRDNQLITPDGIIRRCVDNNDMFMRTINILVKDRFIQEHRQELIENCWIRARILIATKKLLLLPPNV